MLLFSPKSQIEPLSYSIQHMMVSWWSIKTIHFFLLALYLKQLKVFIYSVFIVFMDND